MHCVFCGAKQAEAAAPAKTMMGYAGMADDVIAAAKAQREAQQQQQQQPAPQAPAPQAPPPQAPAPQAPPPADPAVADPYGTTQPVDPSGFQQAPPIGGPPPAAPPLQSPQAPAYGGPAPAQAPAPQAPAYGGGPPPQQPQGAPQMPPYLASETGTRMNAPQEPWAETLTKLCRAFGIMCMIAFFLPWVVARQGMLMSWDFFEAPETALQLIPVFILLTAIAGLTIAQMKVATNVRGWVALAAGLTPILILAVLAFDAQTMVMGGRGRGGNDFDWRVFAQMLGLVGVGGGCLIRSKYPGAMPGRVLATAAAALILLVYLVPVQGHIPLVEAFKALGSMPGKYKLLMLYSLGPFFIAACAMVVWAPPSTTAGAGVIAWGAMLYLPVGPILAVVASGEVDIAESFRVLMIWYHMPVTLLAWFALSSYGLATVVGKKLEHA